MLLFAPKAGPRAGEQLALRRRDVDKHNRLATFRRSASNGIEGPTKSGKERKVPLTSELVVALERRGSGTLTEQRTESANETE